MHLQTHHISHTRLTKHGRGPAYITWPRPDRPHAHDGPVAVYGAQQREIAVESVPNKVTRYDRVSTPTTIANLTISSRNMGSVVASLFKRIFDLYRGRTRTYRIVIGYCIYTRSDDGSYEEFSNIARYRVLNSVLRIRNTVPRSNGSQFSNYSTE